MLRYIISILVVAAIVTIWSICFARWGKAKGGCGCCSALKGDGAGGCCGQTTCRTDVGEPTPSGEAQDGSRAERGPGSSEDGSTNSSQGAHT